MGRKWENAMEMGGKGKWVDIRTLKILEIFNLPHFSDIFSTHSTAPVTASYPLSHTGNILL